MQSAEKKAKKRYAIEIELKTETFILVANNEKEKDMWISKISQAILDFSSIYLAPPPPQAANNNGGSSTGSRTNSSSNLSISESGDTVNSTMPEEDGEEGLLTFDDMSTMS